ncbi:MAG TPA: ElyC/SanA/YdcF family protein [Spirochaetia bacterium]|nr:ElyC/SanA/YdcF family protein [Spirochaetia bacterium]
MRQIRFLPFLILYAALGALLIGGIANMEVLRASEGRLYRDIREVPVNKVGLLLGTSQFGVDGHPNPYFTHRIRATAELYRAGKIRFIIASGDNEHLSYNEPLQMKKALIAEGIPEEAIVLDFAGFRTLDSVVRAGAVFGQNRLTIISQEFHTQRALYIAEHYSLDAVAYRAGDVPGYTGLRMHGRELLARTLAVLDLHVLRTEPRFLGEPIPVM